MDQRVFHGNLSPSVVAQALMAEFNRGNLFTQLFGDRDNLTVQVATRPGAISGGQTGLAINIQKVEDGILVQVGKQQLLGVAASLGETAFSVIRNPISLLGRLDDIAQDIESLTLVEKTWQVIDSTSRAAGASYQISERLSRLTCEYCGVANPVGEPSCIACGAPLGDAQPTACMKCGFVITSGEDICPNCGQKIN